MPIAGVSIASVTLSLILFNLLFAVENMLDIAYLSRALPLPRGMGMAEYVHRGAYPLIVTALLAGLFVLVTLRPGSSTAHVPAIRRLVVLWIAQNVILVASSIQRTLDYIDVSMFTALRIHALAWMALVACGLMLICWRMLREKAPPGSSTPICCWRAWCSASSAFSMRAKRRHGGMCGTPARSRARGLRSTSAIFAGWVRPPSFRLSSWRAVPCPVPSGSACNGCA